MAKHRPHRDLSIKRSAIRKDLLYFALPAIVVWFLGLGLCGDDGFSDFWGTLWNLIKHPQDLLTYPAHGIIGLTVILFGFVFLLAGQITLGMNHSSSVVIRVDHQLITHGVFRFTRNPMYLGVILIGAGIAVYTPSLKGFLVMLLLIPLFLIRIRLEERLLTEEFGDAYLAYKNSTSKLFPFLY